MDTTDLADGGNTRSLTSLPGLSPAPRRFSAGYDPPQRESGSSWMSDSHLTWPKGVAPVRGLTKNLLDDDVGGGCSHVIFRNAP